MMWIVTLILANYLTYVTTTTGVNFVPQNEFYSTYSMWALSFSIDLRPYYDNIAHINHTAMTLRPKVITEIGNAIQRISNSRDNVSTSIDFESEMVLLRSNLMQHISLCEMQASLTLLQLTNTLDDLTELYTQTDDRRQKRSLLPWAGDLLGSLFGTATKSDMSRLRQQINSLSANENELVHVVENSLSIINKTNSVVANNRRVINILSHAADKLDRKIRMLNNVIWDRERIQDVRIGMSNKVITMTNAIIRTLRKVSNMVHNLSDNMNRALRNQLSTTLVAPEQLRDVLGGISRRIPSSLTLKEYDGNRIMWYYKHLPVTVVPDQDRIHLISVIPLIPVESLYTLYRMVVLPIPIEQTEMASVIITEGTHFAISKQGNSYVILDDDELSKCQNLDTTYCPLNRASMNLARMPSCLGSLYLAEQDGITRNCPVKISNNVKFPIFRHLVQGKWMIASKSKIIIHQRCDVLGDVTSPLIVTPPVQIITLQSGCTGYTEYARLPPYFYKSSSDLNPLTPYERLNVGAQLTPIWNIDNSNYTYDYQLINAKSNLPDLPEVENIDMSQLKNRLDNISREKIIVSDSNKWKIVLVTVAVCVCVGLLLISGVFMYVYGLKMRKNKYRCAKVKYSVNDDNDNCIDGTNVDIGLGRGVSTEDNKLGSAAPKEPELIAVLRGTRPGPTG